MVEFSATSIVIALVKIEDDILKNYHGTNNRVQKLYHSLNKNKLVILLRLVILKKLKI